MLAIGARATLTAPTAYRPAFGLRGMATLSSTTVEPSAPTGTALVMQLIVDAGLLKEPGWSMGPMMAQAAHATSAVLAQTSHHPATQSYLSRENLVHMRKVVLQTPAGTSLRDLSRQLSAAQASSANEAGDASQTFPAHHLWTEQPEDVPTVLAIAPNARPSALKKALNKCSLLRD